MQAWDTYNVCMKTKQTLLYTIRGVPARLNASLREKAKMEGKSLNKITIEVLMRGLGLSNEKIYYDDLDDLAGTWVQDPAFDRAIEEMDQVDADLWK